MDEISDLQEFANDEVNRFVNKEFSPEAFNRKESIEDYISPWLQLIDYRFEKSGVILIYPIGEINNNILVTLSQYPEWKNYWGPQYYFDLLYDIIKQTLEQEEKPEFTELICDKINNLDFNIKQKGYLLFGILTIIKEIVEPIDIKPNILEKRPKYRPLMKLKLILLKDPEISKALMECPPWQQINYGQSVTEKTKDLLEYKQIALIYYYNDKHIRHDNAAEIAANYNLVKKTSGLKLYQDYLKISKFNYRTGRDDGDRQIRYKVKLINSVLEYLDERGKAKALNELKELDMNIKH